MPRFRTSRILLTTLVGFGLGLGLAVGVTPALAQTKKASAAKKAPVAKKAVVPAKKAAPPVSPENKKKMQDRLAGFKFGMTKDEVLGTLEKQVAEKYDERLKATTDVAQQDRIRKERRSEISRVKSTYVTFEMNKPSPWDVSIVEEEFVHGTNEAMMERWENDGGKNNRRFFFFHEGKLWKMFIQLDVSILPEDKKNFETFSAVMVGQFGPGAVEGSIITWTTPDLEVRAIDKLKTYDAIGLSLEDPVVKKPLLALRVTKAPPKKETNSIIKAVLDTDKTDKPDVKANSNAVDSVIKAQKK